MDFSYLELLASTALRENNPSQSNGTSTQVDHPQLNHHDSADNEEDDDEADGKTDVTSSSEIESEPVQEGDLTEEDKMGSVKCGKPKKTSGKSVSIFVRDGKCVGKKIHTGDTPPKERGSEEVTGHSVKAVPSKLKSLKSQQDLCLNNNSAHSVPVPNGLGQASATNEVEDGAALCNGVNSINHLPLVMVNREEKPVQHPATGRDMCVTAVSTNSEPAEALLEPSLNSQSKVENALDVKGDTQPTSVTATDVSCDPLSSLPTAAESSDQTQPPVGDRLVTQKEQSISDVSCSDSVGVTNPDTSAADSTPSELSELAQEKSGEDKSVVLAPSQTSSVTSDAKDKEQHSCSPIANKAGDAMETEDGSNCDEDCFVLPRSFQDSVDSERQDSLPKDIFDQDMGSSGNKKINPSTSSVDSILSPPPPPPLLPPPVSADVVLLDHCYSGHSDKMRQNLENTDDSGDAFESADENVSADEIEHRPRSLSVDSVYLQQGQAGALTHQDGLSQNDKMSLLSPTLSVDSISNDSSMSEHSSAAGGQCYSILAGCPNPTRTVPLQSPSSVDSQGGVDSLSAGVGSSRLNFNSSLLDVGSHPSLLDSSSLIAGGPKCGKFRIGTFGSFSNSHLDLDKDTKKSKLKIGLLSDSVMKTPLSSPAVASPGSPFPLLQSPGIEWDRSDAGSEAPDDLDSSTTEDKFLSSSHDSEVFGASSSQIWNHPVFHDHDYCCKEISEKFLGKPVTPAPQTKTGKRKYVKKKDRLDMEEDKIRKGKYLKRELLKQDNRFSLAGGGSGAESRLAAKSSLLAESLTSKPNPVGRPRKRIEKQMEEYDAETGTKMKITGKYQDQYVYYLNKSSRNRRRKFDEKLSYGDRIILPAPKPGDIVVPHLTDADCEAIRFGGRMALSNSAPAPGSAAAHLPHADGGDMDSSIVNTILSMETEHGNLASPLGSYDGDGDSEDFGDIEGNLTSEQVKMLIDCLDTYHMEDTVTTEAMDLLTSAEDVSVSPTAVDSMAPTTVEEDFLVPGDVKVSSGSATTVETSGSESQPGDVKPAAPEKPSSESEVSSPVLKQNDEESDTKSMINNGLPVPPVSQPSVEKNLQFLKTPITKSDFFPAVSTIPSSPGTDFVSSSSSALLMAGNAVKTEEVNETPWIVTVTLYWNDIPAIIINNMPHVRLVDIHRQILPAKDTGILKKRCQLMNIPVTNCSEMQRYFLVQYGRAHNSKSTLVISKDEAQRLISYYAHPPPRNLRGEDAAGLRRSSSYAELRSFMETPSHPNRHSALAFAQPRKRGGFRRRAVPSRSHNPSPEPLLTLAASPGTERPPPSSPHPVEAASPVKGLRHKKINFREMLKGEDSSPHSSPSLDSQQDEDPSAQDDVIVPKGGRGRKAGAVHHKRRHSKEVGDTPSVKRGRKAQRRKEDQADVLVDGDSPDTAVVNVKSKKRSPGSAASGSLSSSNRSPKSRFGPIKVNVKSLVHAAGSLSAVSGQPRKKSLFGRKSSSTDHVIVDVADEETPPRSRPLRVLRISHQDAEAGSRDSPKLLSPMAEVHLDLYKRSASPCVKCGTCDKFLSVPGFLEHQHVSGGELSFADEDSMEESGASQKRRMLVPMNKENISVGEQQMWNEFVALQERLDHTVSVCSMGAYPLTPLSPASPSGSSFLDVAKGVKSPDSRVGETSLQGHDCLPNGHDDTVSASDSEAASVTDVNCRTSVGNGTCSSPGHLDVGDSLPTGTAAHLREPQISVCSPPPLPISTTHTEREDKFVDSAGVDKAEVLSLPKTVVTSKTQRHRNLTPSANVRTSSRKRETKRLYSFEKYEFGGSKKSARGEGDGQDSAEDLPGTPQEEDSNSSFMNSHSLHFASGAIDNA